MIEIQNITPIHKGNILASCDVHIIPWKLTLHDILIFEKGDSRWITMPSKQVSGQNGEILYKELITFDNNASKKRFRDQIMEYVKAYLELNPSLTPEDVIKEEDCPF